MSEKKRYFIIRTSLSCAGTFIGGFVSMSMSKQVFDSILAGLIILQIYSMINSGMGILWDIVMTRNRTRRLRLQRWFVPHYNSVKYVLLAIALVQATVFIVTGLKYYFVLIFTSLIFKPFGIVINDIESRVENIILEADTLEDMSFIASKSRIYTTLASMSGMGLSSLLLLIAHITVLPLWICLLCSTFVGLMDEIEMSRYINKKHTQLMDYYNRKIIEVSNKTVFNESIA